jgi:hypothetical protein
MFSKWLNVSSNYDAFSSGHRATIRNSSTNYADIVSNTETISPTYKEANSKTYP